MSPPASCARRSGWWSAPAHGQRQDHDPVRLPAEINTPDRNIMTIEDPVEYVVAGDQPDPDQPDRRRHLRRRAQVDPAPGPRRDPRGRDPRRRDGPHRRPVGPDRPPRSLVAPRHRLGLGPLRFLDMGIESFLVAARSWRSSVSGWCAGSAPPAGFPTRRRRRSLRSTARPAERRRRASGTARDATSAPTPATRSASGCTRCSASTRACAS